MFSLTTAYPLALPEGVNSSILLVRMLEIKLKKLLNPLIEQSKLKPRLMLRELKFNKL